MYISPYCRLAPVQPNFMTFGVRGELIDVITCVKFLVNRFRVTQFWHPKIAISHWLAASPLQQCTHCRATLIIFTTLTSCRQKDDCKLHIHRYQNTRCFSRHEKVTVRFLLQNKKKNTERLHSITTWKSICLEHRKCACLHGLKAGPHTRCFHRCGRQTSALDYSYLVLVSFCIYNKLPLFNWLVNY